MGEKVMKKKNINYSRAFSNNSFLKPIKLLKKNPKIRNFDITKRNIIQGILMISTLILANETCPSISLADEVMLTSIIDETLAYRFEFPTITTKREPLHFIFSRRPEKYSSAAPISANTRQRIVCELIDLNTALVLTVSVSPTPETFKNRPLNDWSSKEVVEEVLANSTAIRNGQQISPYSIESISVKEIDGQTYCYYEHTSKTSPSAFKPNAKDTYRHGLTVSTVRLGLLDNMPYIYTINISCPESFWSEVLIFFFQTINSFRLTMISEYFISPEKNLWLFF